MCVGGCKSECVYVCGQEHMSGSYNNICVDLHKILFFLRFFTQSH